MKALELQKVYYGQGNFIIHDVNFSLEEGDWAALIGASGSGKTTLIKLMGNIMRADVGRILYWGHEMYEDEKNIRRRTAVLFNEPNFNVHMRTLQLAEEIKKFEPWFDIEAFKEYMTRFGISNRKRIRELSTGTLRKYMLVLALCRKPELLIMDEPTSGLDEKSRQTVWETIQKYREDNKVTILFTTHHRDEVEKYATRVLELSNGGVK